ncbi:hypothetical protein KC353_g5 [Hortaea werneckii]|nr:hypothetical protein KC353_g5 [Hortaea werneckii]
MVDAILAHRALNGCRLRACHQLWHTFCAIALTHFGTSSVRGTDSSANICSSFASQSALCCKFWCAFCNWSSSAFLIVISAFCASSEACSDRLFCFSASIALIRPWICFEPRSRPFLIISSDFFSDCI